MPAPTLDEPRRVPLDVNLGTRDNSVLPRRDARLINGFMEHDRATGAVNVFKRPGYNEYANYAAGIGRGIYAHPFFQLQLVVLNNTLHHNANAGGGDTLIALPGQAAGASDVFSFASAQGLSAQWAVLNGGGRQYLWQVGVGATTVTDITSRIGSGANSVPGVVNLDGTTYVMDSTAGIWGSNFNDPTTWNGLNKAQAGAQSEIGVALNHQLNYVVAFNRFKTHVFYDAGNPTGSPLTEVLSALCPYGCFLGQSVQNIDEILLWITANEKLQPQVALMAGLIPEIVSTPPVERLLGLLSTTTLLSSWSMKITGHRFYGLTTSFFTLVYDIDEKAWYLWTGAHTQYWPIVSITYFVDPTGLPWVLGQDAANGTVYSIAGCYSLPTDDGVIVPVDIYTPNFDAGVTRRKNLNNMYFEGDQTDGSILEVRVSDDDYQSWSNFRTVDMSLKQPVMLSKCGTFYRRAWHLRHACATPLRIRSINLQMDIGTL